jgi:hypothetical protein
VTPTPTPTAGPGLPPSPTTLPNPLGTLTEEQRRQKLTVIEARIADVQARIDR